MSEGAGRDQTRWSGPILTLGQQEGCHRSCEAVRILPEEEMAQTGKGDELGTRDALGEQSRVARVDYGVRVAVHDQRACPDTRLPQAACVPRSRAGLSPQDSRVRGPVALQSDRRSTSSGRCRTVRADSVFSEWRRTAASAVMSAVAAISRTVAAGMG
jgi:hypothetical protein